MENNTEKTVILDPATRYEICKTCDLFFKPTRQCRECMCFMNVKTKTHSATCPIGKW